ncbi:MAG: oligoendopeptidase F [Christensenellaceae bacterium]|jgi:oligoendopeptidase F|nr:oligoendopeptidase F [Christensenellaceae bacterium]
MPLSRSDVCESRKWDLSGFFANDLEINSCFSKAEELIKKINGLKKTFKKDEAFDYLDLRSKLFRLVERLYVYAYIKQDENTTDAQAQAFVQRTKALFVDASTAISFIEPTLSALPTKVLEELAHDPLYTNYSLYLLDISKNKKHIRTKSEEMLLSWVSSFSGEFRTIFTMIDNADMRFESITLPNGENILLSHGEYSLLLQNSDRSVRESAFKAYYKPYIANSNTITATYYGSVCKDCALAKIRKHKNSLAKALFSERIDPSVYNNLLSVVKRATPSVHSYVNLRKRVLNLKSVHAYDMYVPLIDEVTLELDYDAAYELVVKALNPLGATYCEQLVVAYKNRWIDVEQTQNKRNGAYSTSCYDVHPVVLLNYQKTTHDIFTIAHEMGHAMHSYLSNKNQCYEKADYPIFLAEIASTVNEILLLKHLLKNTNDENMKAYLLSYYLDMFRTTVFRQTMFAEFELFAHTEKEAGNSLTIESLNDIYRKLNETYYGENFEIDNELNYEWSRIPHFYSAFYVYKYATGFLTAVNISARLLQDSTYLDNYLTFLSSGGSAYPLDILKAVGIDLTKKEAFDVGMREFTDTLDKLSLLL